MRFGVRRRGRDPGLAGRELRPGAARRLHRWTLPPGLASPRGGGRSCHREAWGRLGVCASVLAPTDRHLWRRFSMPRSPRHLYLASLIAFVALGLAPGALEADGFIFVPEPPPHLRHPPHPLP